MNQSVTNLGQFDIPNDLMRVNYRYVPLTSSNGTPVTVTLGGTNTLRLTLAGTSSKDNQILSLNYLLFVPAPTVAVSLFSAANVQGPYAQDAAAAVDTQAKTITVPQSGTTRFYQIQQPAPATKILGLTVQSGKVVIHYQ